MQSNRNQFKLSRQEAVAHLATGNFRRIYFYWNCLLPPASCLLPPASCLLPP
ncbi:MAG: hypothetical protein F6K41_45285, partial [Symploca sp. SIO3E6]|nr:hypothetical protein [Caldora sp. SIO3E6]